MKVQRKLLLAVALFFLIPDQVMADWDLEALRKEAVYIYFNSDLRSVVDGYDNQNGRNSGTTNYDHKERIGSFRLGVSLSSRHFGSNEQYRERNPGFIFEFKFKESDVFPGNPFLTSGNILNSHGGRTRFIGYGWEINDLVVIDDYSFGIGLANLRKITYGLPDYDSGVGARDIKTIKFSVTHLTGYSINFAVVPADAILFYIARTF